MALLDRVTISGADDSISANILPMFSFEYPFVEWGILASKSNEGGPRYPSRRFRDRLTDYASQAKFNISVHVQGRWLRDLLIGDGDGLLIGVGRLLKLAERVQFNFHGGSIDYNETKFMIGLMALPLCRGAKQFIFQADGCQGYTIYERLSSYSHGLNLAPFYDTSHGTGVLPNDWPLSNFQNSYVGYAGGLGPDNLADQIPLIAKAAGGGRRFWIDMETGVRTGEKFDLEKVGRALEICKQFVGKEI